MPDISVDASFSSSKTVADPGEAITFTDNTVFSPPLEPSWAPDEERSTNLWKFEVNDDLVYSWTFASGSPATSDSEQPGSVSFASNGNHAVTLTVTRTRHSRKRYYYSGSQSYSDWENLDDESDFDTASGSIEIALHASGDTGDLADLYDPTQDPDGDPTTDLDHKYWRVYVPDFNGTRSETAFSYLRLGAVEEESYNLWANVSYDWSEHAGSPPAPEFAGDSAAAAFPPESGEDLAALVMDFDDDYRYRGGPDDGNAEDQDRRIAESVRLHTRGGWRDHTDGNRITTTRGDKVEVIAGNFKRIVLGRRQFANGDHGDDKNKWGDTLDVSGGVGMDIDQTPFATTDIRWDDTLETWKVTETGGNGFYVSETTGYSRTVFNGRQDSYSSGTSYSYHGPAKDHSGTAEHQSVSILDLSWPDEPGGPIDGSNQEQKTVDVVDAETWSYHNGKLYERSVNPTVNSQSFWGAKGGVDIGGISGELEAAIQKTTLALIVNTIDVKIATAIDIALGAFLNIRVGPEMNIVTSGSTDIVAGVKQELSLSQTDIAATHQLIAVKEGILAPLINVN